MSLRRHSFSVAAASAVHSVLAMAASVAIARILGPEGRGTYAIATLSALLVAQFGTFGFETGSTVAVGRDPPRASRVAAACVLLALASGLVLTVLLPALAGWHGGVLFPQVPPLLVRLCSLAIPFLILSALLSGVLAGLGQLSRAAWTQAAGQLLSLVLVALAAALSERPLGPLVAAFAVSSATVALALAWTVVRQTGLDFRRLRDTATSVLGLSLTSHAAYVLHLLHLRLDVFLINAFLGPREAGLYALSQAICEWAWLLPRSAASALMPAVAGTDAAAGIAATARLSRFVLFSSGVTVMALAALAGLLVPWLFGQAFAGSVLPLRLLAPGIWIGSAAGVLSAYLTGRGWPQYPLLNSFLSLLLNVALNLALIPRFGIAGAAAASALTYAFGTVLNVWFVRRIADVPLRDLLLLGREEFWTIVRARGQRDLVGRTGAS